MNTPPGIAALSWDSYPARPAYITWTDASGASNWFTFDLVMGNRIMHQDAVDIVKDGDEDSPAKTARDAMIARRTQGGRTPRGASERSAGPAPAPAGGESAPLDASKARADMIARKTDAWKQPRAPRRDRR